jgi:hypothetical protein
MVKRIRILLLGAAIVVSCLETVGPNRLVATLEAVIGRPLTPMSVAGVARRTARRCAAGVYC